MADFEPCTLDDVRDALNYLDYADRDMWVRCAFAIKSEFGDAGFDIWNAWSQQYDRYQSGVAKNTWRSAKQGGGVTIASLFKAARDNGYRPRQLDDAERDRLKAEHEQRAVQVAAERAADEQRAADLRHNVGVIARELLEHYTAQVGPSKYLATKQVRPYGVRFINRPVVVVTDEAAAKVWLISDPEQIKTYLKNANRDEDSFKYLRRGVMVIPMKNGGGHIMNLQLIFSSGKKSFLKGGQKQGCYHLIGQPGSALVLTEGYATGASIHEATGLPLCIAFDAGNLMPVAQLMRQRLPNVTFIFAGDDDWETEQRDGKNPGREKAQAAAAAVGGVMVLPKFAECVA